MDVEKIVQDLLQGYSIHVDDTFTRCVERLEYGQVTPLVAEKSSFNVSVRTYSNDFSTLYMVNPHKDDEGLRRDGVLEGFLGVLVHDHDKKFYKYCERHEVCGSHLSRELKGLYELHHILWADKFRRFYVGLNRYKECDVVSGVVCCVSWWLFWFGREYDVLFVEGEGVLEGLCSKGLAFKELRRVFKCLRMYKGAYLLFFV